MKDKSEKKYAEKTQEVSESIQRRSSVRSEPYMMGGRKTDEGGNANRSRTKLNYAQNDQERQIVYDELIGSFTAEEINLFTPWIDRDEFGNLVEDA